MKNIKCSVFGHDYKVSRHVTYHVKEYKCCNCNKELTTSSKGNLTELTPKLKEINDVLERIHQKKNRIRLLQTKKVNKNLLVFSH